MQKPERFFHHIGKGVFLVCFFTLSQGVRYIRAAKHGGSPVLFFFFFLFTQGECIEHFHMLMIFHLKLSRECFLFRICNTHRTNTG